MVSYKSLKIPSTLTFPTLFSLLFQGRQMLIHLVKKTKRVNCHMGWYLYSIIIQHHSKTMNNNIELLPQSCFPPMVHFLVCKCRDNVIWLTQYDPTLPRNNSHKAVSTTFEPRESFSKWEQKDGKVFFSNVRVKDGFLGYKQRVCACVCRMRVFVFGCVCAIDVFLCVCGVCVCVCVRECVLCNHIKQAVLWGPCKQTREERANWRRDGTLWAAPIKGKRQ